MVDYETKCDNLKSFKSGAKRDSNEGKGAYELITPFALERLSKVYERGATQKGARNWEKGIPFSRCLQSAIRHTNQYLMGMKDEDHLMQACWNLFAIAHQEEMIQKGILPKELNDLPNYNSIKKDRRKTLELYLAHPLDSRKKIKKWELKFEKRTGINLINPFYDNERSEMKEIDAGRQERYKLNGDKIVIKDVKTIAESDGIISIVDGSLSYGTIQEMVYAKEIHNKPVYSIITNGHHEHPWLKHHSTKIFLSLKEFEDFAMRNLVSDEN